MDTATSFISIAQLFKTLGSAAAPLLLDVRAQPPFQADSRMLASATWRDPATVTDWRKYLPVHRDIVVHCVRGHEISKNTCSALREIGLRAYSLEGGAEAWKSAGLPTIEKHAELRIPAGVNAPTKWVTRERPKIDRIACPWLIRRFIDPTAEFIYVPGKDVLSVAESQNAIAYDVPNVQFTHRGDMCSFDALMADFKLNDPVLADLAVIVRGADTGKPDLTPQSAGLLAISLGLSELYRNDHDMLAHGMVTYDALYAWLKSARAEIHNADLFKKS
jgi:rhodanese-related sulfurtransferase